MEDDDDTHSHPSPPPTGRISVTVAAAAPPSSDTLTLALPIQHQKTPGSAASSAGGGGREDCWSEAATAVLIEAWGERYLELSRGNLKQKHWKEVADVVSSQEEYGKTPKTDVQCKNRIDTVKKKYKVEKAKAAAGGGPSKWRFYDRMDELIGPTAKVNSVGGMSGGSGRVPMGIPVGARSGSVSQQKRKRPPVDSEEEESEPENSADSSDGLPPDSYMKPRMVQREALVVNSVNAVRQGLMNNVNAVRQGLMNKRSDGGSVNKESNWGNSMRELTRAILKFGEAYEQAETAKLQQLVEMEKQRMKFAKDLELQRMQYFMKTQMELSQLKNRRTGGNNSRNGVSNNNDHNNNNNSDSSN